MQDDFYTPENLARLKARLEALSDKWDRYTGNNPDKYRGEMRQIKRLIGIVEGTLASRVGALQ